MSDSLEGMPIADVGETGTVVAAETAESSDQVEESKLNTEESTESTDDEAEKVEKPKKAKEEKPEPTEAQRIREGMQKRIDRQTAANKRNIEDAANWKSKVESLEAQLKEFKPQEDASPREDDYETFDDYNEAVVKHRVDQQIQERMQEGKADELRQAQEADHAVKQKAFDEAVHAYRIDTPDYPEKEAIFGEVLSDVSAKLGAGNQTLAAIQQIVLESDVTPNMIYELGNTPELVEELSGMSPVAAARELFKLEQSLQKTRRPKSKPQPKPITPVGASGKFGKSPDEMNASELMEWIGG